MAASFDFGRNGESAACAGPRRLCTSWNTLASATQPAYVSDDSSRHPRYHSERGNVAGEDGSRTDERTLANGDAAEHGDVRPDRGAPPDLCRLDRPVGCRLHRSVIIGGPGIAVVGEQHAMPDEDLLLDGHALADEGSICKRATNADP